MQLAPTLTVGWRAGDAGDDGSIAGIVALRRNSPSGLEPTLSVIALRAAVHPVWPGTARFRTQPSILLQPLVSRVRRSRVTTTNGPGEHDAVSVQGSVVEQAVTVLPVAWRLANCTAGDVLAVDLASV